ncbi:TPA: hypothetical protein M2Q89_000721 [Escherichia coli]|nr:hypothetical protein [Escherichia coli]
MNNNRLEVPETELSDHLHTTVKVALGAVPYIGGALAEVFSSVIESPFQKRKHEWMKRVVEAIHDLQESGIQIDTLKDNEAFISAVFYASHLAMKTHQDEKLNALKNAIENVALNVEKDEVYQQVFLNYVDTLTVLHMRLLRFAKNPNPPSNMMMGSLESIFDKQNTDLNYNREFINQAWKELYNNGLIDIESMNMHSSSGGLRESRLTDLGKRFTKFITKAE